MEKYDCSWKNHINELFNFWFVVKTRTIQCDSYNDFHDFLEYVAGCVDIIEDGKRQIIGEFTWKNEKRKCNIEVKFTFYILSNRCKFEVLNHDEVWGENTSKTQE